jgi:hypothetical protein
MFNFPNFINTINFAGLTLLSQPFEGKGATKIFPFFNVISRHLEESLILINGFYGFG